MEGTGSYGVALNRYLRRHQVAVTEVNRPDRAARRRHGKTDTVDAVAAAHAVLSQRATTTAKTADGPVEILRLLRLARASAVKSRTQAINQLKAVIISADPALRDQLTGCTNTTLIRRCADLPDSSPTDVAAATRYTLLRLARRIQALTTEECELQQQITAVLDAHAPHLLQRNGIGPDSASALLVTAGDNPTGCTPKPPSPPSAASAPSKPPQAKPTVGDSTAAATAAPTPPSTASRSPEPAPTKAPATTSTDVPPKATPAAKSSAASSATSRARSTTSSDSSTRPIRPHEPLDKHRASAPGKPPRTVDTHPA